MTGEARTSSGQWTLIVNYFEELQNCSKTSVSDLPRVLFRDTRHHHQVRVEEEEEEDEEVRVEEEEQNEEVFARVKLCQKFNLCGK